MMTPDEVKELLRIRESVEARLDAAIAPKAAEPPWVADQPAYHPETATVATVRAALLAGAPGYEMSVTEFDGIFRVTLGPAKEV